MTLLFDRGPFVRTAFAVKSDPDRAGYDTVLVGRGLWDKLCLTFSITPPRVALVVSPLDQYHSSRPSSLRSILCWAVLDDEVHSKIIPCYLEMLIRLCCLDNVSTHSPTMAAHIPPSISHRQRMALVHTTFSFCHHSRANAAHKGCAQRFERRSLSRYAHS